MFVAVDKRRERVDDEVLDWTAEVIGNLHLEETAMVRGMSQTSAFLSEDMISRVG